MSDAWGPEPIEPAETNWEPDLSESPLADPLDAADWSEPAVADTPLWDGDATTADPADLPEVEPAADPLPGEPEPGDLDWQPSETGVQYPPEFKEGNYGGPERMG